jgi:hypothetical protein
VAKGDPVTSPYTYDSGADYQEHHLTCALSFDEGTRVLTTALVHRDPGCVYLAILIGDPNGTPVRLPASGAIPEDVGGVGTSISHAQLDAALGPIGVTTIEQVLALNITATA